MLDGEIETSYIKQDEDILPADELVPLKMQPIYSCRAGKHIRRCISDRLIGLEGHSEW